MLSNDPKITNQKLIVTVLEAFGNAIGDHRITSCKTGFGRHWAVQQFSNFLTNRLVLATLFSGPKNQKQSINPVVDEAVKIGMPVKASMAFKTCLSCHARMYKASQYLKGL